MDDLERDAIFADHRLCGVPTFDGCYSHLSLTKHCRMDGMHWPCDVARLAASQPAPDALRAGWHAFANVDPDAQCPTCGFAAWMHDPAQVYLHSLTIGDSAADSATHQPAGLDVERLAAALDAADLWIEQWASPKGTETRLLNYEEAAAAIARAYAATPQPAEEEGR